MRNWSYLCFLLLLLAACKPIPSNKPAALTPALPDPDSAAVAGTLHRFYTWYDSVSRTPNWKRDFTDTRGKYAKLDPVKLDRYFNALRASGLLSAEYFTNEKKYLDQCAAVWKSHKEKDEMLSGLDHDRLFCAQDWDLAFWASAPVRLLETDSNRVEATMYGTEGGTHQEQSFDLVNENGQWMIARVPCQADAPQTEPEKRAATPAPATAPEASAAPKSTKQTPHKPVVTVNRRGVIMLSGKKVTFENLRAQLQKALLAQAAIPDKIPVKSIGEVGMGTRHEVETLVGEAIMGAKWVRKKAALETLNAAVGKKLAMPTQLQVNQYRTSGSFALLDTRPLQADGAPMDYTRTDYRLASLEPHFADRAVGLLKYEKGAWKLKVFTIGLEEIAASTWIKRYGAPRVLFKKM